MSDDIRNCGDLDERLAPYVDGESTDDTRRAISAHLAKCPPCRRDAEAESAARTIVHEHKDGLRPRAPESLRERCAALAHSSIQNDAPRSAIQPPIANRPSFIRRWVPLSLAASVLLAVAAVFLFGLNNRVEALAASLALDHARCFKTLAPNATVDPSVAAASWQHDQGWPITVPRTDATEQLCLVSVRRCFSTDGRAAHLMYTWRGAPLSVYVLQGETGRDRVVDKMGREAAIWSVNRRTYAVVADGHPQDLPQIVAYIKSRVQ
jgi:anti-sigma factor (TIGR02949 family)